MVIIVEGIDRVGKTTLCNRLSETLNIPIYKHSQRFMDYTDMDNMNETDKMLHLLDICDISNTDMIFDRFHFSDYAYGIIERHYDETKATNNLLILDHALSNIDAIIVFICPTDIVSSSEQHGKDLRPYFGLMKIACAMSKTLIYQCDYNSINETVKLIKEVYNAKSRV
jgi:hypothetical protein